MLLLCRSPIAESNLVFELLHGRGAEHASIVENRKTQRQTLFVVEIHCIVYDKPETLSVDLLTVLPGAFVTVVTVYGLYIYL